MDNFNDLLKQKVEQFDVPYNEAHWAEMEGKLNTIRTTKIRRNILSSAGVVAVIALSSYFYFSSTTNTTQIVDTNNTTEINTTSPHQPIEETLPSQPENKTENNTSTSENNTIENNEVIENTSPQKQPTNSANPAPNNANDVTETKTKENTTTVKPNAGFIVFNNRVCLGGEVSFESNEKLLPVSYTWNFGDGTISHKANPTHVYKESMVYTVTLTLLNRQTGIEYSSIQQDVVTILPSPAIAFTYSEESKKHDDNALKYPYTTFNVKNIAKKSTYQWSFGNGENSTSAKAKTIYETQGSYVVKLVATNSYGCENSTKKKVVIKNGTNLFVQSAFTPNADGNNDDFIPKALLDMEIQFEMVITDKANKVVYKTSNKNDPWNGRLNNIGSILPKGIYLWKIVTYDAEGKAHQHIGKVHLLDKI